MINNPFLSRALAVTLLVSMLALFATLIVLPFFGDFFEDRRTVQDLAKKIASYEDVLAQDDTIRTRLAEIQAATDQNIEFFPGGSAAILGAGLQDRVRKAIATHGGDQRSAQVLAPKAIASHVQTRVRVVVSMPSARIIELLNDLEQGSPTVLIGDFTIRTNARRSQRAESMGDPELTLSFHAIGFGQSEVEE